MNDDTVWGALLPYSSSPIVPQLVVTFASQTLPCASVLAGAFA